METQNETRVIIPALLILLIVVGTYMWFGSHQIPASEDILSETQVAVPNEHVEAGNTMDLNKAIPADFLKGVPVEKSNITESSKTVYPDRGVTRYTVSYVSKKTKAALWKTYSDFLKTKNFGLDKETTDQNIGQIVGVKGKESLSAVLTAMGTTTLVQINFIQR